MQPMDKRIMLFNPWACRERTVEEWAETLRRGGIAAFSPKFWNGRTWMGHIEGHRGHVLSPTSLGDCKRIYEQFARHGITVIPWGVPHGHDWLAEAELAAAIAGTCGNRIEIDLEPYGRGTATTADDFWVGDWANIPAYFRFLKERGIYVICNFDPRPPGYQWRREDSLADPLHLWDAAPYIDRFTSQSYDVGFSQEAGRVVDYRDLYRWANWYMVERCGAQATGVVADARAGLAIADRARFAQELGMTELCCWAADFATPDTYDGFAQVPSRAAEPEEEPAPSYAVTPEVLDGLWHIAGLVEAAHPAEADELRRLVGIIKG